MHGVVPVNNQGEWHYMGGVFQVAKGKIKIVRAADYICLTLLAAHRVVQTALDEGVFNAEAHHDTDYSYYYGDPSIRYSDIYVKFEPGVLVDDSARFLKELGFVCRENGWAWQDIRDGLELAKHLMRAHGYKG